MFIYHFGILQLVCETTPPFLHFMSSLVPAFQSGQYCQQISWTVLLNFMVKKWSNITISLSRTHFHGQVSVSWSVSIPIQQISWSVIPTSWSVFVPFQQKISWSVFVPFQHGQSFIIPTAFMVGLYSIPTEDFSQSPFHAIMKRDHENELFFLPCCEV